MQNGKIAGKYLRNGISFQEVTTHQRGEAECVDGNGNSLAQEIKVRNSLKKYILMLLHFVQFPGSI